MRLNLVRDSNGGLIPNSLRQGHVLRENARDASERYKRSLRLCSGLDRHRGGETFRHCRFENWSALLRPGQKEVERFLSAVDFGDDVSRCALNADRNAELSGIHWGDLAWFSHERASGPDVSKARQPSSANRLRINTNIIASCVSGGKRLGALVVQGSAASCSS